MLVEFLEWSCNRRIQAVRKYKIPDESVALLSLLSKHGQREDSKSAVTDSSSLESYTPLKVEQASTAGVSRTARKLFFGSSSSPDFPAQVKSDSDPWFLLSDHETNSNKRKLDYFDPNLKNCNVYQKQPKGLLHEGIEQKISSNSQNLLWLEKEKVQHCGTPLWNAVHANESLRESPWTIEFLNRIKEKSRLREQSLPCGLSPIGIGYSRNIPKATKRKSPSILEYYKYQGDGIGKKTFERKRQKQSVQLSQSSKKEKASASILPTWTPVDKRAKKTLSFARSGNEAQSKLVWSNQSSHARSRRIVPNI